MPQLLSSSVSEDVRCRFNNILAFVWFQQCVVLVTKGGIQSGGQNTSYVMKCAGLWF